jgi:hypothetical protein
MPPGRDQRMRRVLGLAAGAGAAAALLGGCGGRLPEPLLHNIAQIQEAIEQSVLSASHQQGTAYCPTDVPAVKGQMFSCVVEMRSGGPQIYAVTVVTPQGYVTYGRTQ